jgi:predicted lipase
VDKPETASRPEVDPDPEIPALWDDTGGLIEDALARVERGKAFSVILGRLVEELRQTYGTEDARRIILQLIQESMPSDEIAREARLTVEGYTLSVEKTAVLGCFAGTYFMRSKQGASATFPVDRTPPGRLEGEWRKFRSLALARERWGGRS